MSSTCGGSILQVDDLGAKPKSGFVSGRECE